MNVNDNLCTNLSIKILQKVNGDYKLFGVEDGSITERKGVDYEA